MAPPSVEGELESAAVGRVIARYGRALDECYTREALEPGIFDTVEVRLEIARDGSVVRSDGRGFDDAVARCAAAALAGARFPAPRSGTAVASASLTYR